MDNREDIKKTADNQFIQEHITLSQTFKEDGISIFPELQDKQYN